MSKSNNPLKMSASWIGAIIAMILTVTYDMLYFTHFNIARIFLIPLLPISWLYNITIGLELGFFTPILSGLVILTYGFLMGWIIQMLIRRFK